MNIKSDSAEKRRKRIASLEALAEFQAQILSELSPSEPGYHSAKGRLEATLLDLRILRADIFGSERGDS